jgi:3-oxoacyl-[acyl-carrier protein] reductase
MKLNNKIAIVCGGAGGIGTAISRDLAVEGATVCIFDVTGSEAAAMEINISGPAARGFPVDCTSAGQLNAAVAAVVQEFGRIDILVNAAGIVGFGSAATLSEDDWDRILRINLKGVFLACQAVIAPMRATGAGRIINIGSLLGKNGGNARAWVDPAEQQVSGNIAYGVSKAGVHAMTLYLARELARDGITVNAVAPGPIASNMTRDFPQTLKSTIPLGRMGRPEEVAAAVTFLASDLAGFITGEILDVNGGAWAD